MSILSNLSSLRLTPQFLVMAFIYFPRLIACVVATLYLATQPAYAEAGDKPAVNALGSYIEARCRSSDCIKPEVLLDAVKRVSDELGVNPITLLAIVEIESGFRVHVSNRGNIGLSQVLVKYHRSKFLTGDFYDVSDNLRVGALVYKGCVSRSKGSRENALWCYNGHQTTGKQTYVPKVMSARNRISQLHLFQ